MRKLLAAFSVILMLSGTAYAGSYTDPIPVKQHMEMLYPTVLVAVGN